MSYLVVRKSTNRKLGKGVAAVYSPATTCPVACPYRNGGGCYAAGGPAAIQWARCRLAPSRPNATGNGRNLVDWPGLLAWLRELPAGTLLRLNVAGDLPGNGVRLDRERCVDLARACSHLRAWCYTHYPVDSVACGATRYVDAAHNRDVLAAMRAAGLAVLASANSLAHLAAMRATGYAGPAAVVTPELVAKGTSVAGGTVSRCPATVPGSVATCSGCSLCRGGRHDVAFPAHGSAKRAVARVAAGQ